MSSVGELLLAAQTKKSPFISLLEGAAQGFGNTQSKAFENARTLVSIEMDRQEMEQKRLDAERQAQAQSAIKKYLADQDDSLKRGQSSVAGAPDPTLPAQKLERKISQDEKGNYSQSFAVKDTQSPNFQRAEYADNQGRNRIGRWNPETGKIEKGTDDEFAPATRDPGSDPVQRAKVLRNEFNDLSKEFFKVNEAVSRIRESATDPSAAGDLALIFNYMKILDPGSTVREGEFATAQNAGGVPERLRAQANKIASGERLSPEMRADFVNRGEKLFEGQKGIHEKRKSEYRRLATEIGADPSQVIVDQVLDKSHGGPQAGSVEDGYRFKGGDPADSNNWEKI